MSTKASGNSFIAALEKSKHGKMLITYKKVGLQSFCKNHSRTVLVILIRLNSQVYIMHDGLKSGLDTIIKMKNHSGVDLFFA